MTASTSKVSKHGAERPHGETIRLISDGEKGGGGESMDVGEEGKIYRSDRMTFSRSVFLNHTTETNGWCNSALSAI